MTLADQVKNLEDRETWHMQRADAAEESAREWMNQFAEASRKLQELEADGENV